MDRKAMPIELLLINGNKKTDYQKRYIRFLKTFQIKLAVYLDKVKGDFMD